MSDCDGEREAGWRAGLFSFGSLLLHAYKSHECHEMHVSNKTRVVMAVIFNFGCNGSYSEAREEEATEDHEV